MVSARGTSFASFSSVAAELIELSRFCHERGWTPATSGNFSARLGDGTVAITASGRPKGALGPSDIVVVNAEGRLTGPSAARPSAETALHCQLYRHSSEIGAVAHTHSRAATVLSRRCAQEGYVTLAGYEVAKALSRRVGMADKVSFRQAGATALPFDAASFDGAYMIHVGMNIIDKTPVFAGIRRHLKPGGVFAIYDIMRHSDGPFAYPVPWSSEPATNHITPPEAYKSALEDAGFEVVKERNRRDAGLVSMQQRAGGPPVVMGETATQKVGNMRALLEAGVIAPIELIARAV